MSDNKRLDAIMAEFNRDFERKSIQEIMMIGVNRDQWLGEGDCSVCRKRSYCGRKCKAAKKRSRAIRRFVGLDGR